MLCGKPVTLPLPYKDRVVPCGQCLACRINRRRKWTARILLEASQCAGSSFLTLTYDEEHVPKVVCDGLLQDVLVKKELQTYLQQLRDNPRLGRIRYFACGEYGDKFGRPHYHIVLFGKHSNEQNYETFKALWGKGRITLSELNENRAAYVAAYTVKKWTNEKTEKLAGRPPEFTLMSRRPGIAANCIPYLASMYHRNDGSAHLAEHGDVESAVRIDGRTYPMDSFLLRGIRKYLHLPKLKADRLAVRYGKSPPPEEVKDYGKAAQKLVVLEIIGAQRAAKAQL